MPGPGRALKGGLALHGDGERVLIFGVNVSMRAVLHGYEVPATGHIYVYV
jgi:hypothetical protein